MSILVTGSLAYDTIMDFPDAFRNHILPDQLHILNVSFTVDTLQKNLGGCAGNMAHTIQMVGGKPLLLATIGSDGDEYLLSLGNRGISTSHIMKSKEKHTASAFITTDKEDNQITAFYIGALAEAGELTTSYIEEEISLAIIGPNNKDAMIRISKECGEKKIPVVFDPGQMLPTFSAQELQMMVGQAQYLIANDYEMKLIEDKTGWTGHDLLEHIEVLITTLGEKGSIITTKDEMVEIPPCEATSVEDPTGAGDAYRGGFFTGRAKGFDLKTCGQMGSVAATYAIEYYGTQNHSFTKEEFTKRYEACYGDTIIL